MSEYDIVLTSRTVEGVRVEGWVVERKDFRSPQHVSVLFRTQAEALDERRRLERLPVLDGPTYRDLRENKRNRPSTLSMQS